MAFKLGDRVRETSTTTGTGTITLAGAMTGFRAFSTLLSVGDTTWYSIVSGAQWETGIGTFGAGNTLARTTVLESSSGGSAVNFAAGAKDVFVSAPASQFPIIAALLATQAQAEAGTDPSALMTPLRTKQAISAQVPPDQFVKVGTEINAAGAAAVDLVFSNEYSNYFISVEDLYATSGTIAARFATSGATFLTTGYSRVYTATRSDANGGGRDGQFNQAQINLTTLSSGSLVNTGLSGCIELLRRDAQQARGISWRFAYYSPQTNGAFMSDGTGLHASLETWSALRLFPATGTFLGGRVQMYGVKKP